MHPVPGERQHLSQGMTVACGSPAFESLVAEDAACVELLREACASWPYQHVPWHMAACSMDSTGVSRAHTIGTIWLRCMPRAPPMGLPLPLLICVCSRSALRPFLLAVRPLPITQLLPTRSPRACFCCAASGRSIRPAMCWCLMLEPCQICFSSSMSWPRVTHHHHHAATSTMSKPLSLCLRSKPSAQSFFQPCKRPIPCVASTLVCHPCTLRVPLEFGDPDFGERAQGRSRAMDGSTRSGCRGFPCKWRSPLWMRPRHGLRGVMESSTPMETDQFAILASRSYGPYGGYGDASESHIRWQGIR